ncbi:MAG TPA: four helix bundle protein [Dissulfurispiraceae bacterium]|nr:four helix bundle protein [Dissulfurispiraceae bacterium]
MKYAEEYRMWLKGLRLADMLQKIADGLTYSSYDVWSGFRETIFYFPGHLAEAFMTTNVKEKIASFCRALNSLEEIIKRLEMSDREKCVKKKHFRKLKRNIAKFGREIGVYLMYQQRVCRRQYL